MKKGNKLFRVKIFFLLFSCFFLLSERVICEELKFQVRKTDEKLSSMVASYDVKGVIWAKVYLTDYREYRQGYCYLEATKVPATYSNCKFNTYCTIPSDGGFSFSELPPGEYRLSITCVYTCKSPVLYDPSEGKDYFQITTYEHTWVQQVVLGKDQELSITFYQGQGSATTQNVETIYLRK